MGIYRIMAVRATLVASFIIAGVCPAQASPLSESLQELSEFLNNQNEYKRCYEREKEAGTYNYTQCAEASGQRRQDFEAEQDRRRSERRRQKDEERRELEAFTKGPTVLEEVQARYGAYFTFDECMGVFDERDLYGKRGFSRTDARGICTKAVSRLRTTCEQSRAEECAEKGFLRADQTAGAIRQQQLDAQQRQQEVVEQRQEQARQRKRALRDQWIRQGNDPNACPSLQALMDKNHWCHSN